MLDLCFLGKAWINSDAFPSGPFLGTMWYNSMCNPLAIPKATVLLSALNAHTVA